MLGQHISITGGSGHLGTCLIELLLEKGAIVKALYYNFKPPITHHSLTWIRGDITNYDIVKNLMEDTSVMIHCASIISLGEKNKDQVYNTNVKGTQNIINAALFINIRVVYISSSNAVKETQNNQIFDENRPYKTKNDFLYGYTKALSEQLILQAINEKNLDALIIRPTSIIGPPDYKPSLFGKTILDIYKKRIPSLATGGYNLVDVRDLSQTIINSMHIGKKGEIYLVGGDYYSLKEVAKIINPDNTFLIIPLNLLILLLPLINLYSLMFPLKWPVTKESLIILKKAPKQVESTKAIKELNHKTRPISNTLSDLIDWFNNKSIL